MQPSTLTLPMMSSPSCGVFFLQSFCAALQARSAAVHLARCGHTAGHGIFHAGGVLQDATLAQQHLQGVHCTFPWLHAGVRRFHLTSS